MVVKTWLRFVVLLDIEEDIGDFEVSLESASFLRRLSATSDSSSMTFLFWAGRRVSDVWWGTILDNQLEKAEDDENTERQQRVVEL